MLVRLTPLEKLLLLSRLIDVARAGVAALTDLSTGLSRLSMRAIDDLRSDARLCSDADVAAGVLESRLNEFFQWEALLFSSIVEPIESLLLLYMDGSFDAEPPPPPPTPP